MTSILPDEAAAGFAESVRALDHVHGIARDWIRTLAVADLAASL